MKVRLKQMDEMVYSGRIDDHNYTINMYGVVFDVESLSDMYYKVVSGKFQNWILYKEHCEIV